MVVLYAAIQNYAIQKRRLPMKARRYSVILIFQILLSLSFNAIHAQPSSAKSMQADSTERIPADPQPAPTIRFAPGLEKNIDIVAASAMRRELSMLWTIVSLNTIAADVLSLYVPESKEEFANFADGKESELMTMGAVLYQIPISMILLCRVLPYRANRWTNIIASGLYTAAVVAGGSTEPHYVICAAAEVLCMSAITWKSLRWKEESDRQIGVNVDPVHKEFAISFASAF